MVNNPEKENLKKEAWYTTIDPYSVSPMIPVSSRLCRSLALHDDRGASQHNKSLVKENKGSLVVLLPTATCITLSFMFGVGVWKS